MHLDQSDLPGWTGIYVTLAGICMYILLQNRKKSRGQYILIAYTCAMFIASTIYNGLAISETEIIFIETIFNPAAFAGASSGAPMAKNAAYVINIWLADSLVVGSVKSQIWNRVD
jgi:hypothetical protein